MVSLFCLVTRTYIMRWKRACHVSLSLATTVALCPSSMSFFTFIYFVVVNCMHIFLHFLMFVLAAMNESHLVVAAEDMGQEFQE